MDVGEKLMSHDYMDVSTLGSRLVSIANKLGISTKEAKKHTVKSLLELIEERLEGKK